MVIRFSGAPLANSQRQHQEESTQLLWSASRVSLNFLQIKKDYANLTELCTLTLNTSHDPVFRSSSRALERLI